MILTLTYQALPQSSITRGEPGDELTMILSECKLHTKSLLIAKGLAPGSTLAGTAPRYPVLLLIFAPATGGHLPRHLLPLTRPRDGIRAHVHKLLSHLHVGQYTCMEKVCSRNCQSCYQGYTIGPLIKEYHYCNT